MFPWQHLDHTMEPFFRTSEGNDNWFENLIVRDVGGKIIVFDRGDRVNDFGLTLSRGSKKWELEKSGYHCTCNHLICCNNDV